MKKNLILFVFLFVLALISEAQTVYVTDGGKKYHKKNCSVVKEGKKGMELAEAKKQGYTACAVCKPDDRDGAKAEATELKKKK